MALIEKLGTFYLGKEYDLPGKKLLDEPLHYDSRNLTTHAVCIGMTGSGKTGLCLGLLEEAAIDKVPAIIVDPKGDLTNLLLTFPELLPEDFEPWINEDDAARRDLSPKAFAAKTAQTWREGLASWDQGPERIRLLKESADFAIYTPGSDAGLPVSVLSSFRAPKDELDAETMADRVSATVSALLGLIGIQADPVRSREYILLANIVEQAWRAGKDLDLASLIKAVQNPGFGQLGVFDLDTFYPVKDRFELALMLNSIIASPSFAPWLKGESMDVAAFLRTRDGKPRHSIFYIAHLSDSERMFFLTLLLGQLISWMRSQAGTSSLRALFYMDEVFGYMPPLGEPPSKRQLLTLLKQARAFGLGIVLSTQNPVDLDYKGLSNAGTWFIGKLQTERDKKRLMEGLESIGAESSALSDPKILDKLLSSLDKRIFLMHSVHEDEPVVFNTRWAMSYLAGPLTRPQVKILMDPRKRTQPASAAMAAPSGARPVPVSEAALADADGLLSQPPMLPPGVESVFLPVELAADDAENRLQEEEGSNIRAGDPQLVYEAAILGSATVRFFDKPRGVNALRAYNLLKPGGAQLRVSSWQDALSVAVDPGSLPAEGESGAQYAAAGGSGSKQIVARLTTELRDHLYGTATFELAYHPKLKLYAEPEETEREFQARVAQAAREARDAEVDRLRDDYAERVKRLAMQLEKEEQELAADKAQRSGRVMEEALSGLSTVGKALGLFGRRSTRGLSSVATKRRMTAAAQARVDESVQTIERVQREMAALDAQMQEEIGALTTTWGDAADDVERISITPRRSDVQVDLVALAWAPYWYFPYTDGRGREQTGRIPAFAVIEAG